MRYILRHVAALAPVMLIAAVVSCSRELDGAASETLDGKEETAVEAGELRAVIVNPGEGWVELSGIETRTDFDEHVGKFAWSEGDKIAIHLSDGTFYETPVDAETGVFTCSTTPTKQRDAYAVYPASARDASNYGSPTLKVVLPTEYDITGNLASDFAPVPMIAVNRQGEDDLYFRHVGSVLRITCDRVPSGTRFIRVTFDRNVAGSFPVLNPASDHPTLGEGGDSKSVTFRVATNNLTQRTNGIVLNVPVPVGDFTAVTLSALNGNRSAIQTSTRDLSLSLSRGHGKKLACNVTPAFYDSMQLIINASDANGMTFDLAFPNVSFPADVLVDWGDGASSFYPEGTAYNYRNGSFSHTYSEPGEYTITLTATTSTEGGTCIPRIFSGNHYTEKMLKSVPTPILPMIGIDGRNIFSGCAKLQSVCGDLFSKNPQITDFNSVFYSCGSLRSIPAGLFDNNPAVLSFQSAFAGSGIFRIPAALFAHNHEVTNFYSIFSGCRNLSQPIPEDVFAGCGKVTDFGSAFWGCSYLQGPLPGRLFADCTEVTTFQACFCNCDLLSGPLPAELFANNTKVTSFNSLFTNCYNLDGVLPAGFFANNPLAVDFYSAFNSCNNLSLSEDIFISETVTPETRFMSVESSVKLSNCFLGVGSSLTSAGTAPALWTFTFPEAYPPVSSGCFYRGSKLSNWEDIPTEWR